MGTQTFMLAVAEEEAGQRLDQFLAAQLPYRHGVETSRRQLRRLIERGAVYLAGKRVRVASRRLRSGAVIEVHWDADRPVGKKPPLQISQRQILFEDDDLIAVEKPSGMPTQATVDNAEQDLHTHLSRLLIEREGRKPYLALHHRLDQGTSGIVLLARHPRVNRALSAAFQERTIRKTYVGLCTGQEPIPTGAFTVHNRLQPMKRRMEAAESRGKVAISAFRFVELVKRDEDWLAWVVARPSTGRKHQLRVHLADAGWPVLGDRLYGHPSGETPRRLHLHACRLELEHPIDGRLLRIESLPQGWPLQPPIRTILGDKVFKDEGSER